MKKLIIILLTILSLIISTTSADDPPTLQPITRENQDQVVLLDTLGADHVYDLAWSSDGKYLAVGSQPAAELYDTADFSAPPRRFYEPGDQNPVWNVAFTPDSRMLMTSNRIQRFWDVETGELLGFREDGGYSAALHPSENILVAEAGDHPSVVDLVDITALFEENSVPVDLAPHHIMSLGTTRGIESNLAFSPDGSLLAQANNFALYPGYAPDYAPHLHGDVTLWKFTEIMAGVQANPENFLWEETLLENRQMRYLSGNPVGLQQITFNPTSTLLAGAYTDGSLVLWDTVSGEIQCNFSAHFGAVWDLAFTADGNSLLSVGWDGAVRQWEVAACGVEQNPPLYFNTALTALAFSPDQQRIAVGAWDGRVWVIDLRTGQQQLIREGHLWTIWTLAFSPDDRLLAAGDDNNDVWLWDVETRSELRVLRGHRGPVSKVAFNPDGSLLVSGSVDRTIRLWDVQTGEMLYVLQGHTSTIQDLEFSPDGLSLASVSLDGTMRLWDVTSGSLIQANENHDNQPLYDVAFSLDGKWLAFGSAWIWELGKYNFPRYYQAFPCTYEAECYANSAGILTFSADSSLLRIEERLNSVTWQLGDPPQPYEGEFEPPLQPFSPPTNQPSYFNFTDDIGDFNSNYTLMAVARNGAIELWAIPEN